MSDYATSGEPVQLLVIVTVVVVVVAAPAAAAVSLYGKPLRIRKEPL